jgi:hypothetical protein
LRLKLSFFFISQSSEPKNILDYFFRGKAARGGLGWLKEPLGSPAPHVLG